MNVCFGGKGKQFLRIARLSYVRVFLETWPCRAFAVANARGGAVAIDKTISTC